MGFKNQTNNFKMTIFNRFKLIAVTSHTNLSHVFPTQPLVIHQETWYKKSDYSASDTTPVRVFVKEILRGNLIIDYI